MSCLLKISSALAHLKIGKSVIKSIVLAAELRRKHHNVLRSLDAMIAGGTLNHLRFKVVEWPDGKGKFRGVIALAGHCALIGATPSFAG